VRLSLRWRPHVERDGFQHFNRIIFFQSATAYFAKQHCLAYASQSDQEKRPLGTTALDAFEDNVYVAKYCVAADQLRRRSARAGKDWRWGPRFFLVYGDIAKYKDNFI